MAADLDVLVVPRRDEIIVETGGKPSLRFINFLESLGSNSNTVTEIVEVGVQTVVTVTTSTYTTTTSAVLLCTVPTVITLNLAPTNSETVTVNRTNGEVTVNGNGRTINGEASITLSRDKTSLDFFYSSDLNKWYII